MEPIGVVLQRVIDSLIMLGGDDMKVACSNCGKIIKWDKLTTSQTRYELCTKCKEKLSGSVSK